MRQWLLLACATGGVLLAASQFTAQGAWSENEALASSGESGVWHLRSGRIRYCMPSGRGEDVDGKPTIKITCGQWSN